MANHDNIRNKRDDLDRTLDAALAKYASVEPRPGMEERILANLRSADATPAYHTWWRWGLAAAAAMLLILITFAWRSRTPSHPAIANRPAPTEHRNAGPEMHVARRDPTAIPPRPRPAHKTDVLGSAPVVAGTPKLDQFPSPHPLSEQEKILASYIAQFHDEAVMVARARTEALRKDREQEMREAGPDGNEDSQVR
ncbi:MAG: hypothetical protein LAP86_06825 [Acidobacteriia bacterium]|nr:hypothetical protein [Terriglobia bacterium]